MNSEVMNRSALPAVKLFNVVFLQRNSSISLARKSLLTLIVVLLAATEAIAQESPERCHHYCEYEIVKDGVEYRATGHVDYLCTTPWPDWGCENVYNEVFYFISPTNLSQSWGSYTYGCGNIHSFVAEIVPPPTPLPTPVPTTPSLTARGVVLGQ